ncbi:MAG: hypothetical protein O3A92_16500, partial [Verrucomicrobia bacterium]|nr:hypothetical protein [Verrucomicrobiota bacterium]
PTHTSAGPLPRIPSQKNRITSPPARLTGEHTLPAMTRHTILRFLRRHEDDLMSFGAVTFLLLHLALQAIS